MNIFREQWFLGAVFPASPEDIERLVASGELMCFGDEGGVILVRDAGDGDCEWHWGFRPGMPIAEKRMRVHAVVRALCDAGFKTAVGLTPEHNMPARIINRYFGAKNMGKRDGGVVYLVDLREWLAHASRISSDSSCSEITVTT